MPFTRRSLIAASLRHYRATHAMVVAGVAVSVAVLAGALIVGASVRSSLRDLAIGRLGNTGAVVSSPAFFREALAQETGGTPLIAVTGALVHEDSGRTAARVQVFGIDERFAAFHRLTVGAPSNRDAWVSPALARELGAAMGDSLLLRIAKPTDIPLSTLQGRREDAGERIRLALAKVSDRAALGEFSLAPSQGPALTLFVPLARLQRDLDLSGRVNVLLFDDTMAAGAIEQRLREHATLDDYALRVRPSPATSHVVIESRMGVMGDPLVAALSSGIAAANLAATPVLTHLANEMRVGDRSVPYSLITARRQPRGVVLNQWAADDLGAAPGSQITIEYFVWSDEAGLLTRSATFPVVGIEPMQGAGGDPTFAPEYPGLTDAQNITTWDPPFPVDLKRVRQIDEDYWDQWHTSPKAFISLEEGQSLWATPHGRVSSLRVPAPAGVELATFADDLRSRLRPLVPHTAAGVQVRDVRTEALAAAQGTTDFGEYFTYFSFFLVVSGLLLAALFFALSVEQRAREIGLLGAVGFPARDLRRVLLGEAAVLAVAGALLGMLGAIGYAALIMYGLRTWWVGAVGTTELELHVDPGSLAAGVAAALIAALVAMALAFRRIARSTPRELLTGGGGDAGETRGRRIASAPLGAGIAVIAVALAAAAAAGFLNDVAGFFGAGGLLMIAGLMLFSVWLRSDRVRTASPGWSKLAAFGAAYARWRPSRSVLSAALITFACFVLVSVGAFRRDPAGLSLARDSGTGGFVLMAESVVPLMHNPNLAAGREEMGLPSDPLLERMRVTRFRLRPGDETSCLTLYRPTNPRIVAPEDGFLSDPRFTFAASMATTAEELANPWLLLNRRFEDGAVPAVADMTSLTYVFHLTVGDDFVFAPDGQQPVRFRIVGALADSVLQSELIIGEASFMRLFPRHEGYRVWMIDAPAEQSAELATLLEDRLADFGVDLIDTRQRLAAYHEVENTYLSTFQALGGLGLLIGTFGLAAVLARNVLERRRELGLLGAVGFTRANVRTLVLAESLLLVGFGVVLGAATALVAVMPALLERAGALPFGSLALLLGGVMVTGVAASLAAARVATATPVVAALKSE